MISTVVNDNVVFGGAAPCYYGGLGDGGSATDASLYSPFALAVDGATGEVYIADSFDCRVRKATSGMIVTVAGNGSCTNSGDGGDPLLAGFGVVEGLAVDANGDLYLSDSNFCTVRMISGGVISTVGGIGDCFSGNQGDGVPATSVRLELPTDIALGPDGSLYVAEECRVRRIQGGVIDAFAGDGTCNTENGSDGGPALSVGFYGIRDIAIDPDGDLLIGDGARCSIRRVTGGMISTEVGTGNCGTSPITGIGSIDVDPTGEIYLAAALATGHCGIVRVDGGVLTPLAGTPCSEPPSWSEGPSPALNTTTNAVSDIAVLGSSLYFTESGRNRVSVLALGEDADGDGCLDASEGGGDPELGGMRDTANFWDFFDITGDGLIDFSDALDVLSYFGETALEGSPADLRDRASLDPQQPWRTSEADDGVDFTDVLNNLASFGHSCT
jgi:hypothetical protein